MRPEIWHSPVGLTHDAGWELDVRRIVPGPAAETWRRLLDEWLPQWLGVDSVPQMVGAPVHRGGRVRGRVIGCHVGRRVQLRWTPEILDHEVNKFSLCDNAHARDAYGWQPRVDIETGLARVIEEECKMLAARDAAAE